jgi:RHS repeat-associated protein
MDRERHESMTPTTTSSSYNVHRWYSPAIGSYTRPDPIPRGFSIAEGYYRYAIGNPLRFTDPFGLFEIDPSCSDCQTC